MTEPQIGPPSVVTYTRAELLSPSFRALIEEARELWRAGCEDFVRRVGDAGSCVLGAGIAVYVGTAERYEREVVLSPPTHHQGSLVWEDSVEAVVAFLKERGIEAFYTPGRMD